MEIEKQDPPAGVAALGHVTRLVHVDELCKELKTPRFAVIEWLKEMGLPIITINQEPYVHQTYLELAVWWHGRPMELRNQNASDGSLMRQFAQEMYTLGRVYRGMSYKYSLTRLKALMVPLRKARVRGTYSKTSRGVLEDVGSSTEPSRHGLDNADVGERLDREHGDAAVSEDR